MTSIVDAITSLQSQTASLQTQADSLTSYADEISTGADDMWVLTTGILVVLMQGGFAMMETGSVRSKNAVHVMFKNLIVASISAIFFWLLGYGFAYGNDVDGLIGDTKFGLAASEFDLDDTSKLNYHTFFFQWTFALTAVTIIGGSVAERIPLQSYFLATAVITAVIYPVVAHWVWGDGWLSPFGDDEKEFLFRGRDSNNFIDFAGSGAVCMFGGTVGLVGSIMIAPRIGRFDNDGNANRLPGHSTVLIVLGTLLLWVGWYGFTMGSTRCITGNCSKLASKVAVVTTISAAFGAISMIFYQVVVLKRFRMILICNAILSALVSISGPCAVVEPWGAMLIGMGACIVFVTTSKAIVYLQIDDPLEAFPTFGACGIWGCLAVGIFGNDDNAAFAGYYGSANGNHPFRTGEQFGVQLIGVLAILLWSIGAAAVLFLLLKVTVGVRIPAEVEAEGLDVNDHKLAAYVMSEASQKHEKEVSAMDRIDSMLDEVPEEREEGEGARDRDGVRSVRIRDADNVYGVYGANVSGSTTTANTGLRDKPTHVSPRRAAGAGDATPSPSALNRSTSSMGEDSTAGQLQINRLSTDGRGDGSDDDGGH